MLKLMNPPTVVKPFSRYSQAVEAPANARWLHISGQVALVASPGRLAVRMQNCSALAAMPLDRRSLA